MPDSQPDRRTAIVLSNRTLQAKGIITSTARRVHAEKKGVRVFAVAESFGRGIGGGKKSVLAGVVMRRDLVIDGMAFGHATIGGDDATGAITSMYRSLGRDDVSCIMLDGLVISMYNIIDGEKISTDAGLPVVAITFEDSPKGLEDAIRHHFPDKKTQELKLTQYARLGRRERVVLKTGKPLYIRQWGLTARRALAVLNAFTLQGALPEPVKVAKIAARSAASTFP
ncbi:DUF99 family protein [Nitrososphaera sp.]|uniref:endonuclease dU n=1 Tax=Nitrososphaera sp. TaxID=1971748 RepID=UPI00307ED103